MGAPLLALAGVQIATTAAGALTQASAARKGAQADATAAMQNAFAQYGELTRQQSEVRRAARAQKGVRASEADRERATLLALAAERGALGSSLVDRFAGQSMHFESEDLARIDANVEQEILALQADKEAVHQGATNVAKAARRRAKVENLGAVLSTIGSGVQIAATTYGQHKAEQDARRRRLQ